MFTASMFLVHRILDLIELPRSIVVEILLVLEELKIDGS